MIVIKTFWGLGCAFVLVGALYAFQRPFREYPSVEHGYSQLPPDWQEKTEWAFARLMYPPGPNAGSRRRVQRTAIAAGSTETGGKGSPFGPRIIRRLIGIFPRRSGT